MSNLNLFALLNFHYSKVPIILKLEKKRIDLKYYYGVKINKKNGSYLVYFCKLGYEYNNNKISSNYYDQFNYIIKTNCENGLQYKYISYNALKKKMIYYIIHDIQRSFNILAINITDYFNNYKINGYNKIMRNKLKTIDKKCNLKYICRIYKYLEKKMKN